MNFRNDTLHIGEVPATELVARFGSPLYVYDVDVIRRQMSKITNAFARLPFQPFYAIKANDNLTLLRLIAAGGFGFDAVSPGEIFLAHHAGVPNDRVWFTCSNVSDEDLLSLNDPAIVINVNSIDEIDRCIALKLPNRLAIRVNPYVGAGHHRDVVTGGFGVKFGIDIADVYSALGLAQSAGLRVAGIHAHIGSGVTTIDPLLESARTLVELSEDFPDLEWINFGGGIAIPYRPEDAEFPIGDYGEGIASIAGDALRRRKLKAILEPGRYVVAQSGVLLTTVTSKRISAGHEWIGCDTGFNHLARPSKYGAYHHIVNATDGSDSDLRENATTSKHAVAIVAGNLCESGDVFTRSEEGVEPRSLAPTNTGDILAICDAGAYGFSMASHYNARLLPPEVLIVDGEVRPIRVRQSFDDLIRGME